jgi:hypothetical protein
MTATISCSIDFTSTWEVEQSGSADVRVCNRVDDVTMHLAADQMIIQAKNDFGHDVEREIAAPVGHALLL